MEYVGEHLWPGMIGHFLVVLCFVSALMSALFYFFGTQWRETDAGNVATKYGRSAYIVHGLSLFGIMGLVLYIMSMQFFEYHYAWEHVSSDLPYKYIFSAFWEGQEGSFMLWMFWHVIIGFFMIWKAGKWESSVLFTFAAIQVFISSMILGLHFDFGFVDFKIGSSPFLLLRDAYDLPLFNFPDYVTKIEGNGLNPLLQNYWMTIHPPTLFLGFASTALPFAYAFAGLWTKQHKAWITELMPYALFSAGILGTGILMGGAWAYEALSFGGYWAWDPVENMSLVPWLLLVGGIHTMMIARATGHSIGASYLLCIFTFLFILYSTFLTRSGVLGDTSVHAFTEMGLEWQLVAFMGFFFLAGLILFFGGLRNIPKPVSEESVKSKEFWMFIGALVFVFSSILITVTTSIPVFSKVGEWIYIQTGIGFLADASTWGPPQDVIGHHNKFQLPIALLIALLSGVTQFLFYKDADTRANTKSQFWKHILIGMLGASVLTFLFSLWIIIPAWQFFLLTFLSFFVIVSNIDYLFSGLKANLKLAGSIFSHVGFGIMMLGVIASGLNKQIISQDNFMTAKLSDTASEGNNVLLYKDLPTRMGDYLVTYLEDSSHVRTRFFSIQYERLNEQGGIAEKFTLQPNVLYNKEGSKIEASNPSTRHYLTKDVFTHIAALPASEMDAEQAKAIEDTLNYQLFEGILGDTFETQQHKLVFKGFDYTPSNDFYTHKEGDISLGAKFDVISKKKGDKVWEALPVYLVHNLEEFSFYDQIDPLNLKIKLPAGYYGKVLEREQNLEAKSYEISMGETIQIGPYSCTFEAFDKDPKHHFYRRKEGDIAVAAHLKVTGGALKEARTLDPVFLIRESVPYNLKDEVRDIGLHAKFMRINPEKGSIVLDVSLDDQVPAISLEVAENVPRRDYLVLEAIVFPGINLFWLGSVMMMLGFFFSLWRRAR